MRRGASSWSSGREVLPVSRPKVYLVVTGALGGGICGAAVREDGVFLQTWVSSNRSFLRLDLTQNLGDDVEIVDLINSTVPEDVRNLVVENWSTRNSR